MTVKQLKAMLETVPEDHEVMIKAETADWTSPVKRGLIGTVTNLNEQKGTFFGCPVIGGKEHQVIILTDCND